MVMKVATAAAVAAASEVKLFITDDVTELTILLTGAPLIPSNADASHHDSALRLLLTVRRVNQSINQSINQSVLFLTWPKQRTATSRTTKRRHFAQSAIMLIGKTGVRQTK